MRRSVSGWLHPPSDHWSRTTATGGTDAHLDRDVSRCTHPRRLRRRGGARRPNGSSRPARSSGSSRARWAVWRVEQVHRNGADRKLGECNTHTSGRGVFELVACVGVLYHEQHRRTDGDVVGCHRWLIVDESGVWARSAVERWVGCCDRQRARGVVLLLRGRVLIERRSRRPAAEPYKGWQPVVLLAAFDS